jgi:hypothetical protein
VLRVRRFPSRNETLGAILGGAGYPAWEDTSLKFGWRFCGIDYLTNRSDGKFAYDGFQTGPYLALTYQFQ